MSRQLPDAELERLCELMHDAYEAAAAGAGWETQQASRKPWVDVPDENKQATRAAVQALMNEADRVMLPTAIAAVRRALDVGHRSFTQQLSRRSDERTQGYNDALRVNRETLDYQLGRCPE